MINYTLGFVFNTERTLVLLMEKQRPQWQKDSWNGVGGKVEVSDQSWEAAMSREFKEEVIMDYYPVFFKFADLTGDGFRVHIFRGFTDCLSSALPRTDEFVAPWNVNYLPKQMISNSRWLIPMALSLDQDRAKAFEVTEVYV